MTYSILAFDPENGALGAAVASRSVAVGGTVTYSRFGVGMVNTQHHASLAVGQRVLDRIEAGAAAQRALDEVLRRTPGAAEMQLLAVDVDERKGVWTGTECLPARAHRVAETCVAAGNTLVSEEVVERMVEACEGARGAPLGERLLAALEAGQEAGGDRRGRQSAAVRVVPAPTARTDVNLDLRVDDHLDPLAELRRLQAIFRHEFGR